MRAVAISRAVSGAFAICVAVSGLLAGPAQHAAAGPLSNAAQDASSSLTKNGTGAFGGMSVTVDKTQNLINEAVSISWTGAPTTLPPNNNTNFGADYLQIMQCWGDDPASGPDASQCEFGGTTLGGPTTRRLNNPQLPDPLLPPGVAKDPNQEYEDFVPAPTSAPTSPYAPPPATKDPSNISTSFDSSNTNEIPYARTYANGTGHVYFQLDTVRESPALGCGQPVADPAAPGGTRIEPCWLVVVPRGTLEADGKTTVDGTNIVLQTSPLSPTNWANRIVFPLTFQPAASACAIGANEVQIGGDEMLAEAVKSWEPGLCAKNPKAPFSFSQIGGDAARQQLASPLPGFQFVSKPVAPTPGTPQPTMLYAPAAISGLTISFYVQSQAVVPPPGQPPNPPAAQNGVQITRLNLNARLVAKLVTQSYRWGVDSSVGTPQGAASDLAADNPRDLTVDPEFLALNPQFKGLSFAGGIPSVVVPFGNADAYTELWTWLKNDPAAEEFLSGVPDNAGKYGQRGYTGMTLNPNYLRTQFPIEDFPTTDPYCRPTVYQDPSHAGTHNQQVALCGLALHPYPVTMHDGVLNATKGSLGLRVTWNPNSADIGSWGPTPPQPDGQVAILVLADAPTAARYGLPTAELCDDKAGVPDPLLPPGQQPSGDLDAHCVAPTTDTLLKGAAAAQPSPGAPKVVVPNPNAIDLGAYPLTTITYAATVPSKLTKTDGGHYADLLDYIAGPGQIQGLDPGDLPPGYAPLTAAMAAQTAAAAKLLRTAAGVPDAAPAGAAPTGAVSSQHASAVIPHPASSAPPPAAPVQHPPLPKPTGPGPAVVVQGTMPAADVAGSAGPTPGVPTGTIRYVVLICLLAAGASVLVGPGLLRVARQSAGGPELDGDSGDPSDPESDDDTGDTGDPSDPDEPDGDPDDPADPGDPGDPDEPDDTGDTGDTSESPGTNPPQEPSPSKGTGQ
ncbi:hypothetical protein ABIA35_002530 [Catenulispora sp. MAP12-49]|uniref:hypothetical protein n=1 Tax=Catenulispora sp. MAP12-49 TaxID=3156302 RepID=UPI00351814DB